MLETEKDFSKFGRINFMLEKRLSLLASVVKLSTSLGLSEGHGSTCETAQHFWENQIAPIWENYQKILSGDDVTAEKVQSSFPFGKFFDDVETPLFSGLNLEKDVQVAHDLHKYLEDIFVELKEYHPLELLVTPSERSTYLLSKQAKIVAMTCTHAAMKVSHIIL